MFRTSFDTLNNPLNLKHYILILFTTSQDVFKVKIPDAVTGGFHEYNLYVAMSINGFSFHFSTNDHHDIVLVVGMTAIATTILHRAVSIAPLLHNRSLLSE